MAQHIPAALDEVPPIGARLVPRLNSYVSSRSHSRALVMPVNLHSSQHPPESHSIGAPLPERIEVSG
jgi:hypothetical protein